MGAAQSSGSEAQPQPTKRCYYEILGIERLASDDDIKKAYRKKALELHPDRNYGDTENATAKFAEVQSAYEVLSDKQERAWYDSHRESILRGHTEGTGEESFKHNVRFTTESDIFSLMGKFSRNVPFTDDPNGFYGIARQTFENLAREETLECEWEGYEPISYPGFGLANNDYETIKPFYHVWVNFSTRKNFSWKDMYRATDASDRNTRRLMEKENKRLRDEGIKAFNNAVRSLVLFVRKRDPRYRPNSQTDEERQKTLRNAAAAQAARARAENQARLAKDMLIPDWAKTEDTEDVDVFSELEELEVKCIECVACRKTFKSEKQYETHEKSKKHIKAVQKIRREMKLESKLFNLESSPDADIDAVASTMSELKVKPESEPNPESEQILEPEQSPELESRGDDEKPREGSSDSINYEESDSFQVATNDNIVMSPSPVVETEGDRDQPRLGKAKLKRARKKAKEAMNVPKIDCKTCGEVFASKNKLFRHIQISNHAQPL